MTAIFAFSSPTVAFIASDTRRVDPFGMLPPATVCKAHFWSDQAVFGQAGTQFQSRMVADTKVAKQQFINPLTGSIDFDDSETWLHTAFNVARGSHHQNAATRTGANLANGSLLVAYVDATSGNHGLANYDFATGTRTSLTGPVAAIGTGPAAFLAIANTRLAAMTAASTGKLALDEWARDCIADAIALYPAAVGWPADLLIARPDGLGGRWVCQRRIDSSSAVGHPDYLG